VPNFLFEENISVVLNLETTDASFSIRSGSWLSVMAQQLDESELLPGIEESKIGRDSHDLGKRSLEFSSENHKLEISNLPSHIKYHVVKDLIERHFKLCPHKIRVGKGNAYVAFASQKERDEAIAKIDNKDWKNRTLNARPAAPRYDPLVKKLRNNTHSESVKSEQDVEASKTIDINDKVCPLWKTNYEEQLKIKDHDMKSMLNIAKQLTKLCPNLKHDSPALFKWMTKNDKICCPFDGVEPSPITIGYRNKCEFNVGKDGIVGFRVGSYKNGSERVVKPPQDCPIVNQSMFEVIGAFQNFLENEEASKLEGFDHVTHAGHIRQLTVRTNSKNECLVIVDLHPQDLTEVELESELKLVADCLRKLERIVSIYINVSTKNHLAEAEKTLRLVHGQGYLFEYLNLGSDDQLKFRIGPTSFFQTNTKAAELLYKSVVEIAQLTDKSLVLDAGCGTGTISLSLARKVGHVLGVEIVESAIQDAKVNALENNISNVTFFAGKIEDLVGESIAILKGKLRDQNNEGEIVAVVDPPRVGFNSSFIKAIRASSIKKIIYIACDPRANTNLIALCRPKSKAYQGDPFVPTRAKAFDMFPHTRFCELVLVYERLQADSV